MNAKTETHDRLADPAEKEILRRKFSLRNIVTNILKERRETGESEEIYLDEIKSYFQGIGDLEFQLGCTSTPDINDVNFRVIGDGEDVGKLVEVGYGIFPLMYAPDPI